MPASLILRLARTSRCAIVASGTRNARAISSVLRPPSVRSVSATCASSRERRMAAGEDQLEPLVGKDSSRPSRPPPPRAPRSSFVFAASVRSRRMRSIARLRAVAISQAPGLSGAPSRGQRSAAIAKASCAASSARSKSPRKPIRAARTRPHSSRKTPLDQRSTTGRTSIAPPMRAAGIRAASSIAASRSSASNR